MLLLDRLERDIKTRSTQYVERLTELSNLPKKSEKELNNVQRARNLGFTNSFAVVENSKIKTNNADFNSAIQNALMSLLFIKESVEFFGEGVLVVNRADFIRLIRKYNLVCGTVADYLGIIPDKNLDEIETVTSKLNNTKDEYLKKWYNDDEPIIIEKIDYWRDYETFTREEHKELDVFPVVLSLDNYNGYGFHRGIVNYLTTFCNYTNISSEGIKNVEYRRLPNRLFVCAPRKYMNNSNKKFEISFSPRRTEDPFVCTLTKYGIVIHSMWGREAEDEALEKYRKLISGIM